MTLSNQQGPVRPVAMHLIRMMLRRNLLIAADAPEHPQGAIECAELALALDLRDEARLLFEIAFVAGGYDDAGLATQEQLRRETLLWEPMELRSHGSERGRSGLNDRTADAIGDLASCLALDERADLRGTEPAKAATPMPGDDRFQATAYLAECVHALHRALQGPPVPDALTSALRSLAAHPLVRANVAANGHVDAPVRELVTLFAAQAMRFFLRRVFLLWGGSLASAAVMHKAAGFAQAGLGPWFRNAGRLVPDGRSLVDLAAAAQSNPALPGGLERVSALLSIGLNDRTFADFVNLLADEGLSEGVILLAERYISFVAASDRPALWRLRDAAIDLGELALAAEIQARLVELAPSSAVEASILAELRAGSVLHGYDSTTGRRDLRRGKARARMPVADRT